MVAAAFVYGHRTIRRCVLAAVVITLALAAWVLSLPPPEEITSPGPTWRSCAELRELIATASGPDRESLQFDYWRYCRDKSAYEQEQERWQRSTETTR
jgi:hypothetical protein